MPRNSTILGAAKLTGRVRDFSVGVLTAATQEEQARAAFGDERWSEVVEPRTFYSVSRARREFSDQSSLGFILTTTSRSLVESVSFLPESAVTGGIDYDWRIGKRWGLNGYWSGSNVSGSAEAISLLQQSNVHSFQRPDAEHVELDPLATSLRGHSGNINFSKIAGERTRLNVNIGYRSPGFDVNDLGFQRRADEIPQNSWFQFRWNTPGKYKRNGNINFNQWSAYNFDGDRLAFGGNINSHWHVPESVEHGRRRQLQRRELRRPSDAGRAWRLHPRQRQRLALLQHRRSSPRQRLLELQFLLRRAERTTSACCRASSLRPTAAFSAEFGVSYESRLDDAQWVNAVTDDDRTTHTCSAVWIRRRARSRRASTTR